MPKTRSDVERCPPRGRPPTSDDWRLGVGVDVVDVPRFSRVVALRGPALCERVFTSGELEACRGSLPRLAARFAAKEAAAKALGVGIGQIGWRDVEIRTGNRGEPELALDGAARVAASDLGLDRWAVSLSHDATRAVALVVALGMRGTGQLP